MRIDFQNIEISLTSGTVFLHLFQQMSLEEAVTDIARIQSFRFDDFLRARKPDGAIVVNASWRDNPWFPAVLEDERKSDLR